MKIQFRKVQSLSSDENEAFWGIFQRSYNLSFEEFIQKQKTLDKYALYLNSQKQLIGYTGIRDHSFELNDKKYRAIYFGQTAIENAYRGKNLIQNTVIRIGLRHFLSQWNSKLIIWNDSLNYRPYLVMAKGLKDYYPHINIQDQKEYVEIRNILGERYYGNAFCSKSGTVIKSKIILKEKELNLSDKDLSDPYIQFYVSKNPNFTSGHGLITFCPGTIDNLMFYLKKRFLNIQ